MKKKLRKQIAAAVNHLPPQKYVAVIKVQLSKGEDEDGKPIPRKHSWEYFPVKHINRAKRLYIKGGWPAVHRYIDLHTPKKKLRKK